jgi:hypothetical protein
MDMNKLEAELKEKARRDNSRTEVRLTEQAIYEGKELRKIFPTYKAVREGGKTYNRLCWVHTNDKYVCLHFDGMDHSYYICPSCGAITHVNGIQERDLRGYIDPDKESFKAVKGASR